MNPRDRFVKLLDFHFSDSVNEPADFDTAISTTGKIF